MRSIASDFWWKINPRQGMPIQWAWSKSKVTKDAYVLVFNQKLHLFTSPFRIIQLRKLIGNPRDDPKTGKNLLNKKKEAAKSKDSAACLIFLSIQIHWRRIHSVDHVNDSSICHNICMRLQRIVNHYFTILHCYSNFTACYSFCFLSGFQIVERIFRSYYMVSLITATKLCLFLASKRFSTVHAGSLQNALHWLSKYC